MICTSWAWPNMFDVARSKISLYSDAQSIVNRVKLLLLTDPTELYMVPNFGVGLKKFMFRYKSDNTAAMVKDALIEQLRLWEPSVIPEDTVVSQGLEYSRSGTVSSNTPDTLELTITLKTRYGQELTFGISQEDLNVTT